MDNATGTFTSLEKFIEMKPAYDTHLDRFVKLTKQHAKLTGEQVDALDKLPLGSSEQMTVLDTIRADLKDLELDAIDNIITIQGDLMKLQEVFTTFRKEIEQLPDDAS